MSIRAMKKREWLGCFISIALLLFLVGPSFPGLSFAAPIDFPRKEITLIVAYGAGGAVDTLARGVGQTMGKYLGVPVVVMNIPGGDGIRGLENLYNSAPDGYTIGVGQTADATVQTIEKPTYDIRKFSYIGRAQAATNFFWVKSDAVFRSVKEFKTFGKPLRYSTPVLTSHAAVTAMILANREGFPIRIVGGYPSGQATALSVIRGDAEWAGVPLGVGKPFAQAGQLRPILTIDEKRSPDLPDVPTVAELGHPDLGAFPNYYWFEGPPKIPTARVKVLEEALMKTLNDPEFLKWAKGANLDISPLNGEETAKMVSKFFEVVDRYKGDIEKHIKR